MTPRSAYRFLIRGRFVTTAPLHVGDGDVTDRPGLVGADDQPVDVQSVVKDHAGKPCIPGTAIKGVLRAWADEFFKGNPAINRLFGPQSAAGTDEAGWAEFVTAELTKKPPLAFASFEKHVPYWCAKARTGVLSHVSIDRHTGAARAGKLYWEEFVPEGVAFDVTIAVGRLAEADVGLLLAVLELGHGHATHPYQFGANGADGWGRVRWEADEVLAGEPGTGPVEAVGFGCCTRPVHPFRPEPNWRPPNHIAFDLTLAFDGPLVVNDADHVRQPDWTDEQNAGRTNFTSLRRADGGVWLPASSFRGALRQRAEFLARSLTLPAEVAHDPLEDGPVGRLFGHTRQAARLTIGEFEQVGRYVERHQDFVAIDRFTGGAADGAKFDATYADRPTVTTRLVIDLNGLEAPDVALLVVALRDVCEGKVPVGFGGNKGYGQATGTLKAVATPDQWELSTQTLNDPATCAAWAAKHLPKPADTTVVATPPPAPVPTEPLVADKLTTTPGATAGNFNYTLATHPGGGGKPKRAAFAQVSHDLLGQAGTDIPVEYAVEGKEPVRIRPAGGTFIPHPSKPTPTPAGQPAAVVAKRPGFFAHPYYFLRQADRSKFTGDLADGSPVGHERYQPGTLSGTLRVKLTTKTPLLLCDDRAAKADASGHKTYPVLTDRDGKPLLASSSVRGMLRAAYEAVTNSRFGVFPTGTENGHNLPLGLRTAASGGLSVVPVRIERQGDGLAARLLPGTSVVGPGGTPRRDDPVYAAGVAMYRFAAGDWTVPQAEFLTHGRHVWAFIGPWRHNRYKFWNVEAVAPGDTSQPPPPTGYRPNRRTAGQGDWAEPMWVRGWLCITGRNIDGKHDERLFFDPGPPRHVPLGPAVVAGWSQLIADYQAQHEEELRQGKTHPPALKDFCVFSRHISHDRRTPATAERQLADGTLCYAAVKPASSGHEITALYPVMISRKLHPLTPLDLLPKSFRPATDPDNLSPADRVFGWVHQAKKDKTKRDDVPAYRGQVRVGPVSGPPATAIETFAQPRPLAILGQPKPAQGRFYLGDKDGHAQPAARTKEQAGYHDGNRVRGPKVYPHHPAGIDETNAFRDRTPTLPPKDQRSSQNRSITGWVKPGEAFTFDLHFVNLSRVELGGLLWLLSLDENQFLRLGLGKPLGFGSVRAELIDGTVIADGAAWAAAIPSGKPPDDAPDRAAPVKAFVDAVTAINPDLLRAFRTAAAGLSGLTVRYPWLPTDKNGKPTPPHEHFHWFVANESAGRPLSLPDLTAADPGLPYDNPR